MGIGFMTVNKHTSTICISFPKSRTLNGLAFSILMKKCKEQLSGNIMWRFIGTNA